MSERSTWVAAADRNQTYSKAVEEAKKILEESRRKFKEFLSKLGYGTPPQTLDPTKIKNSAADVQNNFVLASQNPNLSTAKTDQNTPLTIKVLDGVTPSQSAEYIQNKILQITKDAFFDYGSTDSRKMLERLANDNGLLGKDASPEQKAMYESLKKEFESFRAENKSNYNDARIAYIRENFSRLTAEKLVSMYGDNIDTARSTAEITYLKDGGMVLNNVIYDSQRDNETTKMFGSYELRPGNQCSPTSVGMVLDYLGATHQNSKNQMVDDLIQQASDDGILQTGKELQEFKYIRDVVREYGYAATRIEPDDKKGISKIEAMKEALKAGIPIVASGKFGIEIGGFDSAGKPIKVETHIITIVGFDEKGWIVHDPWGNANNDKYSGSGMYAHYEFGDWDIGSKGRVAYTITPEKKE